MQQRVFTIAENAPVARDTYRLQLTGDTAAITAPGQFVDIRLAGRFLRRPVSVCSWSDGALTLYYKVAGAGTAQLSTLTPGTELDLLVGLGNGFDTAPAGARPLLVGGGVGASPLYGLAQQLVAEGRSPLAVLGFRTAAEVLLADAFEALGIPVAVVTEDGTRGADFLTVTPGVRFADGESGDQKRVTTPERAREIGSDYIVVGRPITQADDPVAAYRRCVAAFVG